MLRRHFIINAKSSIPNNEIWYTSIDGNVVDPYNTDAFRANIVSNTYENGKGIITFDGDVTGIGNSAFQNCKSLTSVTIPNSVTSIGNSAFRLCESLSSITIPNSVTSIGDYAFRGCKSLSPITIPESVTSIGNRALYGCHSLMNITFNGTIGQWGSITKGDAWNYNSSISYIQCTDGKVEILI